jgi:hypothetical protein
MHCSRVGRIDDDASGRPNEPRAEGVGDSGLMVTFFLAVYLLLIQN